MTSVIEGRIENPEEISIFSPNYLSSLEKNYAVNILLVTNDNSIPWEILYDENGFVREGYHSTEKTPLNADFIPIMTNVTWACTLARMGEEQKAAALVNSLMAKSKLFTGGFLLYSAMSNLTPAHDFAYADTNSVYAIALAHLGGRPLY